MQDLWQAHYQILSIFFQKEFIKINVNTDMMIKSVKLVITYEEVCDFFLEYRNFKDDLIECKCLSCNKNYQQEFDEKLRKDF